MPIDPNTITWDDEPKAAARGIQPKNRSYPARSSTGGGVGKVILPTMRWQM
jgi:hypothetical protein